jgi:hypothetical protein
MAERSVGVSSLCVAFVLAASSQASIPQVQTSLPPQDTGTFSMDPKHWVLQFSPGWYGCCSGRLVGNNRLESSAVGWQFTFPNVDGVHYAVRRGSYKLTSSIQLQYTITALTPNPVFNPKTAPNNTCDGGGTVRLYFQQAGDNRTGVGPYEFYRWFENAHIAVLSPGTFTVIGDLKQPQQWTSVYGKTGNTNPAAFVAAAANAANVGFVFGGGCFAGHGVFVDPPSIALFNALAFTVR